MKISKTSDERLNLYILWETLICALMILSTLKKWSMITSVFFAVTFVLASWHMLMEFRRGITSFACYTIVIALLAMALSCFSALKYSTVISFDYFVYVIILTSTVLVLCTAVNSRTNHKTASFILKANLLISFLFIIAYFFFSYETTPLGLSLNFGNQNLLGLWLMFYILYAILCFIGLSGFWRILSLFSMGINIYLLVLSKSRNALIALLLFVILALIVRFKKKVKFPRWFLLTLVLLPLFFVPIYLWLITPIINKGWLDFLISEGKTLSSRVDIWERCFNLLKGHWLTGYYAHPSMRGNMHNMYMVVLCSYGAPMLLAFIVYLYRIVTIANKNTTNAFQSYALCAFFAVLFSGIGEGALFSGGLSLFIPAAGFLYLSNSEFLFGTEQKEARRIKPRRESRYIKTRH